MQSLWNMLKEPEAVWVFPQMRSLFHLNVMALRRVSDVFSESDILKEMSEPSYSLMFASWQTCNAFWHAVTAYSQRSCFSASVFSGKSLVLPSTSTRAASSSLPLNSGLAA